MESELVSSQWNCTTGSSCPLSRSFHASLECPLQIVLICSDISNSSYNVIMIIDPIITFPNLTTLLENVDWDIIGWRIDIPEATLDTIRTSGNDNPQYRQKCWEVYLTECPAQSWKQVADALYREDYLKELELVQKKYLKGGYHLCCMHIMYNSVICFLLHVLLHR